MGILSLSLVEEGSKMKFIAAACLVAAAFAEPKAKADADAALLYGAYGYGGYASPYTLGYKGYAGYAAYAGAYGTYPYAGAYGGHYIGKRSADAEPEANADAEPEAKADAEPEAKADAGYAASPYGVWGMGLNGMGWDGKGWGMGYGAGLAGPYGAYPHGGAYGGHYFGKRSADAEPKADAFYGAYGFSAHGASPYTYSGHRAYGGCPYSYGAYPAYGAYSHYG